MVDDAVARMDIASTDCGFRWYRTSKLERPLVNIRHIQRGAERLADRVRLADPPAPRARIVLTRQFFRGKWRPLDLGIPSRRRAETPLA